MQRDRALHCAMRLRNSSTGLPDCLMVYAPVGPVSVSSPHARSCSKECALANTNRRPVQQHFWATWKAWLIDSLVRSVTPPFSCMGMARLVNVAR